MAAPKEGTLKLLVDKKSNKVIFAEGGKDAVDLLFSLLALPAGAIIKHLTQHAHGMVGCAGNLYKSVETLDEAYIHSRENTNHLLDSTKALTSINTLLSSNQPTSSTPKRHYRCSYCSNNSYYSQVQGAYCPSCRSSMNREMIRVEANSTTVKGVGGRDGFVKDGGTYMIMDDLSVIPMSTISTISTIILLNKFNVKDLSSLQELTVNLGIPEGVRLLMASLRSKMVLTEVFLEVKTEPMLG